MAGLGGVFNAINKANALAASKVGQYFDVYRLIPGVSSGSLVQSGNKVISGFRAIVGREEKKLETEANIIIKVPRFILTCDATNLLIGDVLVERGDSFRADENKPYDGNMWTFAYIRPLKRYVFVQTPVNGQISRARNNPNATDSGLVAYGAMSKGLEQVLILQNGSYQWAPYGSASTPAVIPMGIIATSSRGELPEAKLRLPTDVARQSWDVYCSLLPGYIPMESHIVTGANGDRYYIRTPFMQQIGFQGLQLNCEKLRV